MDNLQTGAHDFFGWLKYGYGRGCAQVSVDIRAGRVQRADAMGWVRKHDGLFPVEYLDEPLENVLARINMGRAEFMAACNRFMSHDLFVEPAVEWGQQLTLKEFA